jgi:hypothetical protein
VRGRTGGWCEGGQGTGARADRALVRGRTRNWCEGGQGTGAKVDGTPCAKADGALACPPSPRSAKAGARADGGSQEVCGLDRSDRAETGGLNQRPVRPRTVVLSANCTLEILRLLPITERDRTGWIYLCAPQERHQFCDASARIVSWLTRAGRQGGGAETVVMWDQGVGTSGLAASGGMWLARTDGSCGARRTISSLTRSNATETPCMMRQACVCPIVRGM